MMITDYLPITGVGRSSFNVVSSLTSSVDALVKLGLVILGKSCSAVTETSESCGISVPRFSSSSVAPLESVKAELSESFEAVMVSSDGPRASGSAAGAFDVDDR